MTGKFIAPQAAGDMPSSQDESGRQAYEHLRREYMTAALLDPHQEISTPADFAQHAQLLVLLGRALNGPQGERLLCSVVRALTTCPQGVQVLTWCAAAHAQRHWQARAAQHALSAAVRREVAQ